MGYVERINNYDAVRDTTVRLGFRQVFNQQAYKIFPKKGFVTTYSWSLTNFIVFNPDNSLNERSHEFEYDMQLKNTGFFFLFANTSEVDLLFPSTFTDTKPLPTGNYIYQQIGTGYQSDFRKPVSYFLRLASGGFYNGHYRSVRTTITFRKQPHLNIALQAEYNKLSFPDPYGSNELFLIAPRVELNFSTKLFWTTFVQYNTQRNNFNINSRLQYRFKPMSDFFLVYTDNYFTDPLFSNKNRAIVFKMNYWLNL